MLPSEVLAIRNGEEIRLAARDLVIGDTVSDFNYSYHLPDPGEG